VAAVAAFVALAASYIVVEATALPGGEEEEEAADAGPEFSPWSLGVLQVVLPLAACAPVVLALGAAL